MEKLMQESLQWTQIIKIVEREEHNKLDVRAEFSFRKKKTLVKR